MIIKNGKSKTNKKQRFDVFQQLHLFESIVNNSKDHVVISLDLNGTILDCNQSVELVYGYMVSEIIGKHISRLYDPREINGNKIKHILEEVRQTGKWKGEITFVSKGGHSFIYTIIMISRYDTEENHIGYNIISHISDREHISQLPLSQELLQLKTKELENINNKMQNIMRLKDKFLANMSHDLRTPLNAILGFAEIIHDGKAGFVSDEHKEYLNEIISSAHLLVLLINDILDLAKIESGKMEFKPEPFDLLPLVSEIKNLFAKIITEKHLELLIEVDPALELNIDPNKFKQVLYNLVSNAFKFTREGGKVSIRARSESKNTFRLEVIDSGIGIAEEELNNIFVEFHPLEKEIDLKDHGTGLGLALSRCIVEAQGGQIGVESIEGKGSTFYVILPRTLSKGFNNALGLTGQAVCKKTPTILIIEHPSNERKELIDNLTLIGYIIKVADNIDDAIERFQISHCDMVILDFFIPDICKWKLLRAFRTKTPFQKAPTLLITGMVESAEFFGYKIHDFLVKPVQPQDLVEALKWSGAHPFTQKTVLTIDDEDAHLFNNNVLKEFGYQVFQETDLQKALSIIEKKHPDVLIINPFVEYKEINGFDFLYQLRLTQENKYTPIIITTVTTLTDDGRERVKGTLQRVMLQKEDAPKNLLSEITKQFPIPEEVKETSKEPF